MSSSKLPDLSRLKISDRTAVDMRSSQRRRGAPFGVVGLALLTALICFGVYRTMRQKVEPASTVTRSSEPRPVNQAPPVAPRADSLDATGYVVAQRKAAVSSKATGRLKELKVVEGDVVESGQIIGVIENDDVQALLVQEEAGLKSAQARVDAAQAEFDDAKINYERAKSLNEKKVIAQSEMDTAESRYRKSSANIQVAKADVALAQARVEKAKVEFEFTLIRAPFAGTVLTKDADVGEIVAPFGSSTNARAALVTIADMESLEVEADVSESNIAKVSVGQKCSITLDSYPDKRYQGVVSRIVPTVDRAKATVQVKIRFVEKDASVIPEMSARVTFQLSAAANARQEGK
ncbi:MAG: efflux RND transporter periplasmic adaptor subunit [Bdellovibrionota bacterium]